MVIVGLLDVDERLRTSMDGSPGRIPNRS